MDFELDSIFHKYDENSTEAVISEIQSTFFSTKRVCNLESEDNFEKYEVGVYIRDLEDEKVISEFITDETVFEISMDDIYICDKRAVFVTYKVYKKLPIKNNRKIPSGEPVMNDYELPYTAIVVVDAADTETLAYGCINGKTYKNIRTNLKYGLDFIGIEKENAERILKNMNSLEYKGALGRGKYVGALIINDITDDFYDRDLPIAQRFHNLCIIGCCEKLRLEDLECIHVVKEEILHIVIEESIQSVGYLEFVAEDGRVFDNISDVLKYAKTKKWTDEHYIIEKINLDTEETRYRFWYNRKLQLVGYEIVEMGI